MPEKIRHARAFKLFGVRTLSVVIGVWAVWACSPAGTDGATFSKEPGGSAASGNVAAGGAGTPGGNAAGRGGTLQIDPPPDEPVSMNEAETCDGKLIAVVRDFQPSHPDFEFKAPGADNSCHCSEKGIVAEPLGPDEKPVYVGGQGRTTSTAANFDQWYRDTPGVNQRAEIPLQFTATADGTFAYDSAPPGAPAGTVATKAYPGFFPIDGKLFGNSGNDEWGQPHNYHFTLELASSFVYAAGDVFRFRGDDDVWVFIDGKRVIDLGGIHVPELALVELDSLGLTAGETYSLHFFFAERHVTGSNFLMETNLRFVDCDAPK